MRIIDCVELFGFSREMSKKLLNPSSQKDIETLLDVVDNLESHVRLTRGDGAPVLFRRVPQAGAHQVDHAQLDGGLGPDLVDRFRQTLQPVAADDHDVFDATVTQLGEGGHPVFGSFTAIADHIPNTSRSPARLIPTATYTARFDTWPSLIS